MSWFGNSCWFNQPALKTGRQVWLNQPIVSLFSLIIQSMKTTLHILKKLSAKLHICLWIYSLYWSTFFNTKIDSRSRLSPGAASGGKPGCDFTRRVKSHKQFHRCGIANDYSLNISCHSRENGNLGVQTLK